MISQGVEGYGRFGSLSRVELERFFHLDEDRRLIAKRRGDHSRLWFALQVVTVRHLGMFLTDPLNVPVELVDYLAADIEALGAARLEVSAVPPTDAELDGHRMEELAGRLATLLTIKSKLPASYLDARQVDHDLITGGWQRLVYAPGHPEGTVHRAAYVFCLLEQFHRHIKHRNIVATASSRWRDPRAHPLSGAAWDTARGPGMNTSGCPSGRRRRSPATPRDSRPGAPERVLSRKVEHSRRSEY